MKIRALIVDDEELARALLGTYVARMPMLELVGSCKNPLEAMQVLREQAVDLLFLDIQMPDLTGIEFIKTMRQKPFIIFTTAYPQYALEGYQLDVTDYLLKPFPFERFVQAVNKVIDRLQPVAPPAAPAPVVSSPKDTLVIKSEHKLIKLRLAEVQYIQGKGEYVSFVTDKGKYLSLMSLKQLTLELEPNHFLRIHKSYIVPLFRIEAIEGNQVHLLNETLPIGASYKEELVKRFMER